MGKAFVDLRRNEELPVTLENTARSWLDRFDSTIVSSSSILLFSPRNMKLEIEISVCRRWKENMFLPLSLPLSTSTIPPAHIRLRFLLRKKSGKNTSRSSDSRSNIYNSGKYRKNRIDDTRCLGTTVWWETGALKLNLPRPRKLFLDSPLSHSLLPSSQTVGFHFKETFISIMQERERLLILPSFLLPFLCLFNR